MIRSIFDNPAIAAGLIACLLFCAAIVAIPFARLRQARLLKNSASKTGTTLNLKPWLARADWAAGKIKSSNTPETKFFLIWAFGALAVSSPGLWQLPQEWQKGNRLAAVILIFPMVAFYLLGYSFVKWRGRQRYGDCFFQMISTPAALGGALQGLIQTSSRLRLEHGLHLKISCIRRTVSGSGENRSVNENILWQDEKVYKAEAELPENEIGHSQIPVFFNLPSAQPECFAGGNESVFWKLEAKTKMHGPDFCATFDVPVFKISEANIPKANQNDSTTALQESIEEVRRDELSKIQVTDGLHGREFFFPAARNLGAAFSLTLFFLIWSGFTIAAYLLFKSLFFEIVFTFVDVLVFMVVLNLWLKSSRVIIDPTGLRSANYWLFFRQSRTILANDIGGIEIKIGMTSGNRPYYNLQVLLRGDKKITVASAIASKLEADWLVKEMTKALSHCG